MRSSGASGADAGDDGQQGLEHDALLLRQSEQLSAT